MTNTVLKAEDLCFAYQNEPVLDGVSFTVHEGDFVSIIGDNGAGKSTLLKLILGELAADSGGIFILEQPIRHFHDWPKIGYVPQGGAALTEGFPATAAEVVTMGLYSRIGPLKLPGKLQKQQALEALKLVEMDPYATRMVGKLSGGQVQRVLIARALAGNSRLLLLDEPTTGVDAASTQALYALLQKLNGEQHLTIIMVTHDIARSTPFVTRTLCLEQGSVVELNTDQIAHEMSHRHKH